MCLARDGAYACVNATRELITWCQTKSIFIIFAKYSGGCSMIQSPNDQRMMHKTFHQLFSSSNYRYSDVTEPTGQPYLELKGYLQKFIDPASFRTIWKCCCKADEFVNRAFSIAAVSSAFASAGVWPRSNEAILGHNPEFARLKDETNEPQIVLSSIEPFSRIMDKEGFIPEVKLVTYVINIQLVSTVFIGRIQRLLRWRRKY